MRLTFPRASFAFARVYALSISFGRVASLASLASLVVAAALVMGCGRMPSPLAPARAGSIGLPHRGVLTEPAQLARAGDGFQLLRDNDREFGLPRFVAAIERAATVVAKERPGGTLVIGDLSARTGGAIMPHLSHRTGRDANLVFYAMTLEGAPVASPGFIHFGADGLAWDEENRRFLRFDVEREWLLVKSLVEDEEARVQWLFVSRVAKAMLLEWARARGEPVDTIYRAQELMQQPHPGGEHDDHIHVRTACSAFDMAQGCEPSGPQRPWHAFPEPGEGEPVEDLVRALLDPIDAPPDPPMLAPDVIPPSLPIAAL